MEPNLQLFKANKKGIIRWLIAIFAMMPILFMIFSPETLNMKVLVLLILFVPYLLLQWIFNSTVYYLKGEILSYKSGFLKGNVEVKKITRIEVNTTVWVGIRPALATNGIIVHYNTFNQLYLAPESNQELVDALLKINPDIKVNILR